MAGRNERRGESVSEAAQARATEEAKLPPLRERMSDYGIDADILTLAGRLHWYALAVTPQSEFVAQKALRRYGLRTFVPFRTTYRHKSRQARMTRQPRQRVLQPVARSYVFAGFEPGQALWFNLFRDVPNVRGAVHTQGAPLRIPGRDMQTLIRATASGMDVSEVGEFLRLGHDFTVGDQVRVVSGPFEGWTVPVVSMRDGFAELAIQMFGGLRSVDVSFLDLARA